MRSANGDLSVRVPVHGPGWTSNGWRFSFNPMTQSWRAPISSAATSRLNVAHELRNPLHIIQGNLEGILDGVYEPTSEHVNATLRRDPRPRSAGR